jgi:hypothetical protein
MFKIRRKVMLSNRHIILVPVIVLFLTAGLYADGCFVWKKGADLNEPTQKAIIYWKKGKEIMVLQVKYEGAAEDFAWIVPLPARPKVSAIDADKSPFAEISFYTQLRRRWGYRGKQAESEADAKVTVLERKIVGVYDVAVLAASDAGALGEWLNNNGYAFPEKRKDVLEHYTRKNWVYVAMRIDRKALESDEVKKLKSGELQPIRFTFAAKEMVYPLKISSVNAGETEVLLYLLADAPMVVKSKHKRAGLSIEENIPYGFSVYTMRYRDPEYGTYRKAAGKELPLTWEALGLPKDKELSLCKYRAEYKTVEMTDDLVFERFKPIPYWRERLRREQKESYIYESEKLCALSVLAYHDTDLLRKLARGEDEHMRELVALYPRTPKELLLELAKDKKYSIKVNLASNKKMPEDILHELANDKDERIRVEVASNSNTSVDTLSKLARDKHVSVRIRVVRNFNTPKELLGELAQDESQGVRVGVAHNRKTPVSILRKLGKDSSPAVRSEVAHNSNTPKELLEELAHDEKQSVRAMVAVNSNTSAKTLWKLVEDNISVVRSQVIYNSNTPQELLEELARDESQDVRTVLAENMNTPARILRKLANDGSPIVRSRVAGNSKTPVDILVELASDPHSRPRKSVANNPHTPIDILMKLVSDEDWSVRVGLAYNRNIPIGALHKLAKDKSETVRRGVALNRNTPEELLRILAKDEDSHVSKAARSALERRGL